MAFFNFYTITWTLSNLYYTDDLGAQVHEVVFEQTPTIEGSYKDSGLTWEQVYFQAELPTQEGGRL